MVCPSRFRIAKAAASFCRRPANHVFYPLSNLRNLLPYEWIRGTSLPMPLAAIFLCSLILPYAFGFESWPSFLMPRPSLMDAPLFAITNEYSSVRSSSLWKTSSSSVICRYSASGGFISAFFLRNNSLAGRGERGQLNLFFETKRSFVALKTHWCLQEEKSAGR